MKIAQVLQLHWQIEAGQTYSRLIDTVLKSSIRSQPYNILDPIFSRLVLKSLHKVQFGVI